MKLIKYDFKLLELDGSLTQYKNKSMIDMLKLINSQLNDKFNAEGIDITRDNIYNIINNRNASKFLKIFVKDIVKKTLDKDGNIKSKIKK